MNYSENISSLIKQIKILSPDDTVGKAIVLFQTEGVENLPVVELHRLTGIVSTSKLLKFAIEHPDLIEITSVKMVMEMPDTYLYTHFSLQAVKQIFTETNLSGLPVVSGYIYIGWINRADILGAITHYPQPPRIGGMATPLGVYLYTSSISAGVGKLGLFLTGLFMALALMIIQNVTVSFMSVLFKFTHLQFFRDFALLFLNLPIRSVITPEYELILVIINSIVTTFLFLVVLRYAPFMSGYHAAEHMSVNAIENGESLTLENVAKMSRVHPRCGTNLISILSFIYLGITLIALALNTHWGQTNISIVVITAIWMVLIISISWRKTGIWIQEKWTTRKPTKKELESGINAAVELISTYRMAPEEYRSPMDRIFMMGIHYVMIGIITIDLIFNYFQPYLDVIIAGLLK